MQPTRGDFEPGTRGGYLRDTSRGRLYELEECSTIGRGLANTIVLEDADVSRSHAEIIRRGEAYVLVPHVTTVSSVNGALALSPTPLREGDQIGIGNTGLRFLVTLPPGARVDPPTRPTGWRAVRASRAPTLFLGRVEVHERRRRETRRMVSRVAAALAAAVAIAIAVAAIYALARPVSRVTSRIAGTS